MINGPDDVGAEWNIAWAIVFAHAVRISQDGPVSPEFNLLLNVSSLGGSYVVGAALSWVFGAAR